MAVDAPEDDLLPGDLHLLLAGVVDVHLVDLAEADPIGHGLHYIALAVLELQGDHVEVGRVGEPLLGILDLHDGGLPVAQVQLLLAVSGHGVGIVGAGDALERGQAVIGQGGGLHLFAVHGQQLDVHGIAIGDSLAGQVADIHVHAHGDVAVLAGPVGELGLHEEVADLGLAVLGVQVHVADDAAVLDHVLVLQVAADAPAEHLQGQRVLALGEIGGDVEVVGGEAVGGVAHLMAVHIEVIGGLDALEGDEDLPAVPALGNGEGGAVVAHGVVGQGRLGIVVVDVVTGHAAPGVDAVGVDDLVEILEGVILVAVGLPGLGHELLLEVGLLALGQVLLQPAGVVSRLRLGGILHQGEVPIGLGEELIVAAAGLVHVVQGALLGIDGLVGALVGDEVRVRGFAVDLSDLDVLVPLHAAEDQLIIGDAERDRLGDIGLAVQHQLGGDGGGAQGHAGDGGALHLGHGLVAALEGDAAGDGSAGGVRGSDQRGSGAAHVHIHGGQLHGHGGLQTGHLPLAGLHGSVVRVDDDHVAGVVVGGHIGAGGLVLEAVDAFSAVHGHQLPLLGIAVGVVVGQIDVAVVPGLHGEAQIGLRMPGDIAVPCVGEAVHPLHAQGVAPEIEDHIGGHLGGAGLHDAAQLVAVDTVDALPALGRRQHPQSGGSGGRILAAVHHLGGDGDLAGLVGGDGHAVHGGDLGIAALQIGLGVGVGAADHPGGGGDAAAHHDAAGAQAQLDGIGPGLEGPQGAGIGHLHHAHEGGGSAGAGAGAQAGHHALEIELAVAGGDDAPLEDVAVLRGVHHQVLALRAGVPGTDGQVGVVEGLPVHGAVAGIGEGPHTGVLAAVGPDIQVLSGVDRIAAGLDDVAFEGHAVDQIDAVHLDALDAVHNFQGGLGGDGLAVHL